MDELVYCVARSLVVLVDKGAKPEIRALVLLAWSMVLLLAVFLGGLWLFG